MVEHEVVGLHELFERRCVEVFAHSGAEDRFNGEVESVDYSGSGCQFDGGEGPFE